jgi:signal peptidase II
MLYADIYEGFLPQNWPLIGGKYVSLWPIFNIADSAIFVGVALILLNQSRFFQQEEENKQESHSLTSAEPTPLVAPDSENRA